MPADERNATQRELEHQVEKYRRAEIEASTREAVLLSAAMHVVRYGKLGKQSRTRLRAAIRASQIGRTY